MLGGPNTPRPPIQRCLNVLGAPSTSLIRNKNHALEILLEPWFGGFNLSNYHCLLSPNSFPTRTTLLDIYINTSWQGVLGMFLRGFQNTLFGCHREHGPGSRRRPEMAHLLLRSRSKRSELGTTRAARIDIDFGLRSVGSQGGRVESCWGG